MYLKHSTARILNLEQKCSPEKMKGNKNVELKKLFDKNIESRTRMSTSKTHRSNSPDEVAIVNNEVHAKEVLQATHHRHGVHPQTVAVDDVELRGREMIQPPPQMGGVLARVQASGTEKSKRGLLTRTANQLRYKDSKDC